jgi:hypothetical protein
MVGGVQRRILAVGVFDGVVKLLADALLDLLSRFLLALAAASDGGLHRELREAEVEGTEFERGEVASVDNIDLVGHSVIVEFETPMRVSDMTVQPVFMHLRVDASFDSAEIETPGLTFVRAIFTRG